jgi:hypothetical protein
MDLQFTQAIPIAWPEQKKPQAATPQLKHGSRSEQIPSLLKASLLRMQRV